MKQAYIVAAKRTAIGNFGGCFANVPAHDLAKNVIQYILKDHSNLDPNLISEVVLGQVLTAGEGQNPARQAALLAGLSNETPAYGVSKVCGSGLKAVALAKTAINAGEAEIILAGGMENMSMSNHCVNLRKPTKMGDASMIDIMIKDGLTDAFENYHMGITAENIAEKFNISKAEQDQFACDSQNKAEKAQKDGLFKNEIVPVEVKSRKEISIIDQDEFIKHGVTIENLAKLKPAFKKDGTVTAGNASGINDGAAVLMIASEDAVKKHNLNVIARIASSASGGVCPSIMGTGPIPASKKALDMAGFKIDDLDLIEANEAFAAQAISVNQQMGWDLNKVNVNGGAIALGHPIGASGARVLVTLLHQMQRQKAKKGLATLCIGGGMGIAMTVEM